MLKKIAIALGLVIATLVVAVIVVPHLIDWKRFEPEIADAVRDATGREITIGAIDLALVPAITFSVRDVQLANPPGFESPDLVAIQEIEGRVPLWPLLGMRVVVDQLIVRGIDVALEVNGEGRESWAMQPGSTPAESATDEDGDEGLPIADLRLDDVRVSGGAFHYTNAVTGQDLVGTDLNLALSLAALDAPLDLEGGWVLNDQQVSLLASVYPLDAVLGAGPGRLGALLDSPFVQARIDTGVQSAPAFGLDGAAALDVPSVGELAAWLDLPYETDPGPLRMNARFAGEGTAFTLQDATIEGDELSARASAHVDIGDDATRVEARLRGGVLNIDHYLPPARSDGPAPAEQAPAEDGDDPFAMLPDEPLDLSGLRGLTADIDVAIDGIAVAGYAAGPIRFTTTAQDGVVAADIDEIGLYDGTIGGSLRLDAGSDTLVARTNVIIANVDMGSLTRVAAGDPPPVAGNVSGRLIGNTSGSTLRELARNIVGEIDVSLESQGGPVITDQLTALSFAFKRPRVGAEGSLRGRAVYGGEEILLDFKADRPLEVLLVGDPIEIELDVDSAMVTTSYHGRVLAEPVPSLDGEWRAEIPSVAALAAWLGQPLPESQADPGNVEGYARFRSDGATGAIEEATIKGEGLDLRATGSFDASSEVRRFELAVEGGVLELDRYMPAGDDSGSAAEVASSDREGGPLVVLPDDPVDLSPLRDQEGRVTVKLDGVRVAGIEAGAIDLEATLEKGVLALVLNQLAIADGSVTARLDADGSGDALGVQAALQMAEIRTADLEALLKESGSTLDGRASADVNLSSNGASVRQLVASVAGTAAVDLPGINLAEGPIAKIAALKANLELAGQDAGPQLEATTTLSPRDGGTPVNADLNAQVGPIPALLADASVPLDIAAQVGSVTLKVAGGVAGLSTRPAPDLQIQLDASRLNDLDAVTGAELPDVGPVSLAARLTTEDNLYRVGELAARLSRSDVGGEITLQLGGDRPRLTADLKSDRIDVAELVGEEPSAGGGAPDESSDAEPPATDDDESDQPAGLLIPDDPLPFDALNALDADAKLHVAKLTTHLGANADDLSVEIDLAEGDLRIAPLTGKSAGGDFEMTLEVLTQQQQTADMNLDLKFRQWRMGTFSEIIRSSGESIGKLDADIQLAGTGGSPHAIASTLDGEVKLIGKGGAVDSTVMQILSIGLGSLFDVFGGDKESTFLNCFVVRFDFTDGIGTAHDFLVDFEDLAILGSGTIDLRNEQLDLLFTPESKNQSFVSLAVPFDVAGPLSSPSIRPNPTGSGVQLMKGAGLALLFLNPITVLPAAAAAAAIIGTGMVVDAAGENPCVVALSHAAAVEEAEPEEGWFDKVKDAIGAN